MDDAHTVLRPDYAVGGYEVAERMFRSAGDALVQYADGRKAMTYARDMARAAREQISAWSTLGPIESALLSAVLGLPADKSILHAGVDTLVAQLGTLATRGDVDPMLARNCGETLLKIAAGYAGNTRSPSERR